MKYSYHIETFAFERWTKIKEGPMQYCQGFLDARKDHAPRNPCRLVRSDGKVAEEVPGDEEVHIGMVAGWPTAEQYERAAERALAKAKAIRDRKGAEEARRSTV